MLGDDFWSHLEESTHVNLSLSFYSTAFDGLRRFWKAPKPKKGSIFFLAKDFGQGPLHPICDVLQRHVGNAFKYVCAVYE